MKTTKSFACTVLESRSLKLVPPGQPKLGMSIVTTPPEGVASDDHGHFFSIALSFQYSVLSSSALFALQSHGLLSCVYKPFVKYKHIILFSDQPNTPGYCPHLKILNQIFLEGKVF
jgi:hypothetical protein